MVQFSSEILDLFGGPNLADLQICGANELPRLPNFLDCAIWNYIANLKHPDPAVVHLDLAILKQTAAAEQAYNAGRSHLLRYIEGIHEREHRLIAYSSAVTQFSACVGAIWQAAELFSRMEHRVLNVPFKGVNVYNRGEKSDLERINEINNVVKHFSAEQAEKTSAPIWISANGLRSGNYYINFDELVENIVALSDVIGQIFVEIPKEALERQVANHT